VQIAFAAGSSYARRTAVPKPIPYQVRIGNYRTALDQGRLSIEHLLDPLVDLGAQAILVSPCPQFHAGPSLLIAGSTPRGPVTEMVSIRTATPRALRHKA